MSFLDLYRGSYADGAPVTTQGKLLPSGNTDLLGSATPALIAKQVRTTRVNNTDINAIVVSVTNKTVGISVNTQVESKSSTFNKQAEAWIKKHNQIGNGELTGTHHASSAYRAKSDTEITEGGFMVRHHYNNAWEMRYKYELVSVDMIDYNKNTSFMGLEKTNYTRYGMVFNKWNQITGLWLYKDANRRESELVSYKNLTYYSEGWLSLGQRIALTRLVSILPTVDRADQLSIAALQSAIEAAKAGAYIKSSAYNELMQLVNKIISETTRGGDAKDAIGRVQDLVRPILQDLGNLGIKPHGVTPIPSQDEIQFDPRKRDSEYLNLTNKADLKMSASLGMSDIGVFNKASDANYSSIKYTLETDQLTCNTRWDNLTNKVINEINKRIIEVGIQLGAIKDRVAYWKNPEAFNKFRYIRQNNIDTEPAKNAIANKTNISLGLDTVANIIEKKHGIPYEDFLLKADEQRRLKFLSDLAFAKWKREQDENNLIVDVEVVENSTKEAVK